MVAHFVIGPIVLVSDSHSVRREDLSDDAQLGLFLEYQETSSTWGLIPSDLFENIYNLEIPVLADGKPLWP